MRNPSCACARYIHQAASSPRKNVATVAAHVVAIESISGDASIGTLIMKPW
jgi:hypothetical protein